MIARGEGIDVHLPVDPERVTAAMFHPVNDAAAIGLESAGSLDVRQADRGDRTGPETAGLDVGAPAGTTVYSPVDGEIASVSDYVISGRIEGYEIIVTPSVAASGLVLRLTHLDEPTGAERPASARRSASGRRRWAGSATSPPSPARSSRSSRTTTATTCTWSSCAPRRT